MSRIVIRTPAAGSRTTRDKRVTVGAVILQLREDSSNYPFIYIGTAEPLVAEDAAGWTVTRQEILPDTTSVVLVAEGIEWTNRTNVNNWN